MHSGLDVEIPAASLTRILVSNNRIKLFPSTFPFYPTTKSSAVTYRRCRSPKPDTRRSKPDSQTSKTQSTISTKYNLIPNMFQRQRHRYLPEPQMENENQMFQLDHNTLSRHCPWQADNPQPISRQQRPTEEGLQWGSDPSFCYHGYSSPIGTWTEERLVQNLMRNMASFCATMDIGFNIPESMDEPSQKPILSPSQLDGLTLPMFQPSMIPQNERLSETPSSPSLSPSSQGQILSPDDTECTQRASCVKARNRSGQKKRKCVQKPGQKLCHCRSEKKRRELVRDRYKELCRIVPGLEKQEYTRKYVLEEAALWIQRLVQGNDALHQQLGHLKEQEKLKQLRLFPIEEEEEMI